MDFTHIDEIDVHLENDLVDKRNMSVTANNVDITKQVKSISFYYQDGKLRTGELIVQLVPSSDQTRTYNLLF